MKKPVAEFIGGKTAPKGKKGDEHGKTYSKEE